jgi:hypothetical protein
MMVEYITWISAAERMPDSGITVLVRSKDPKDSEPVWLGWHEHGSWFAVDAAEYTFGAITHWAEIPKGPP